MPHLLYNIVSAAGMFVLMALAWAMSGFRRPIPWRVILWGLGIQFVIAFLLFAIPAGRAAFVRLNNIVFAVMSCAGEGSRFLFGRLAIPPGAHGAGGEESLGFFLVFQALPTIVFFAALMGALYYVGFMPWLVRQFARVFARLMRVSGAEALVAASNIFVGIESATAIRPYISRMTRSELATLLTAGMATIASSVLGFYSVILRPTFPMIAGHLISASLLSAPAAILMAKLAVPETETPLTLGVEAHPCWERESGLLEAVMNGAMAGMKLVGGIIAMLLAFLGIVALCDLALYAAGGRLNAAFGWSFDWTLRNILGYAFRPLTLAIGVPVEDVPAIARVIGERTIATEMTAYQDLASLLASGGLVHPGRSALLAVYALCGFAHVASLAIFAGGAAALAPERMKDISSVGPRALAAATLACLLTACVAGVFHMPATESILLGSP